MLRFGAGLLCRTVPAGNAAVLRRQLSAGAERIRVCVVGAGPAGFYTANQLIKKHEGVEVDLIEQLPVPYGLVRFGVAPDHPEVKNCTEQFDGIAKNERVRFFGNVTVGDDVSFAELKSRYSAVVLSYGANDDKKFGIPGEDLDGVYSARSFVGWYNGLPREQGLAPKLDSETAVVLGQGNVALDIARMLTAPIAELAATDITSQTIAALKESQIKKVVCIGRRGALEAAFTIKELREQAKLDGCDTVIHPADVDLTDAQTEYINAKGMRARKRLTALMQTVSATPPTGAKKQMELMFRRSPVEIYEDLDRPGRVGGVRLEINVIEGEPGATSAKGTGETVDIPCGAVFRSIGYKGEAVCPELPFNASWNVIPSTEGRCVGEGNVPIPGVYASGWIRTGPTGVIATTMTAAYQTANSMLADISDGTVKPVAGFDAEGFFGDRSPELVTYAGWKAIELVEREQGAAAGKPSEKCTSIPDMLKLARKP